MICPSSSVACDLGSEREPAVEALAERLGERRQCRDREADPGVAGERSRIELAARLQLERCRGEAQVAQRDQAVGRAARGEMPGQVLRRQRHDGRQAQALRPPVRGDLELDLRAVERRERGEVERGLDALRGHRVERRRIERELEAAARLHQPAGGGEIGLQRARERRAERGAERCQVRHAERQRGLQLLAVEVDLGLAGEPRDGNLDREIPHHDVLRRGLAHGQRDAEALAEQRRPLRRHELRRRPQAGVEPQRRLLGEREVEMGIGARQVSSLQLQSAPPAGQRPGAGQPQREIAGIRAAAECRQQAAGLAGPRLELERRRIEREAGVDRGLGARLVEASRAQREHRAPAVDGSSEVAGQREGRGLAEHRRPELDALDREPPQLDRRQALRQLGQPEGLVARLLLGGRRRQAQQPDRAGAGLVDHQPAAEQRARRPGEAQILELEPGAVGIGQRQPAEADVERQQAVEPGELGGAVRARQRALDLRHDQPLAGAGLGEAENGEQHEQDDAQRDPQRQADASGHRRTRCGATPPQGARRVAGSFWPSYRAPGGGRHDRRRGAPRSTACPAVARRATRPAERRGR